MPVIYNAPSRHATLHFSNSNGALSHIFIFLMQQSYNNNNNNISTCKQPQQRNKKNSDAIIKINTSAMLKWCRGVKKNCFTPAQHTYMEMHLFRLLLHQAPSVVMRCILLKYNSKYIQSQISLSYCAPCMAFFVFISVFLFIHFSALLLFVGVVFSVSTALAWHGYQRRFC